MDYLGLTNTVQIRAALTVDEESLPDEVIDEYGLEDELGMALDKAFAKSETPWADIVAVPASPNARRLRVFAKYFCAATLAVTAQTFILKKTADGSNEAQRSDKDGFSWMAPALLEKAASALDEVLEDLDLADDVVLPFALVTRVIPDRDPITESRG